MTTSSKGVGIRHESELAFHLREFLRNDPDLDWEIEPRSGSGLPETLDLQIDDRRISFKLLCELKPSVPWVESLLTDQSDHLILVTPKLSTRILNTCKEQGIGAIDLNGRTWLRTSGLLVDRKAIPGRSFSYELEPKNIFVGKSARISRCLLTDHGRIWTQAEIVERTGASSGLVSRIVHHLINQGFVEKISPRELKLRDYQALLDEWVVLDRFSKRTRTTQFAGFLKPPGDFAHDLKEWAQRNGISIAFTQWLAAWQLKPFTEPVVCSAYVSHLPDSASLKQLGLRRVEEGGKLWLHVPNDDGIFTEKQDKDDLPLVTDAQIYLDLQGTGLRGPDAADALRNWEGFCQP